MQTRQRGTAAEALVLEFLLERDYTRLDQNFVRRFGELDLVVLAPDRQTIVFVEVRYRHRADFGSAIESVDAPKRRKLELTALAWLQKHKACDSAVRFDVVGVKPDRSAYSIDWVQGAFELSD